MKHIVRCILSSLSALVLFSSCANYTMTRDQLYSTIKNGSPREAIAAHAMPLYSSGPYRANGVREIVCTDKKGNTHTLMNSPQIEMRITDTNGHKHYFYFDTVYLLDSVFVGSNSRIFNGHRRIHYANIKKVEVQNGRKAYYYSSAL